MPSPASDAGHRRPLLPLNRTAVLLPVRWVAVDKKEDETLKVLVACEYSGRVRDAFREKGHDAYSCDILPSDADSTYHIQGDVLKELQSGRWDLMIAHPPCTRLANSGVRWLHNPPAGKTKEQMWDEFERAVDFYLALRNAPVPMKCIENPVMHKYAREKLGSIKRQVVQPWWFGEEMFKATGYELHGLPDLVPTNKLEPPEKDTEEHKKWSWVHRCPPGPDRWKIRSTTPLGIAQAMAEQWG